MIFSPDQLDAELDAAEAEFEWSHGEAPIPPAAPSSELEQFVATFPGDTPAEPAPAGDPLADVDLAVKLQEQTIGVQFGMRRFGTARSFSSEENRKVAEEFEADEHSVGGRKKLVNTKHPHYRKVTRILHRAVAYWRAVSVPYPQDGVRLMRTDRQAEYVAAMDEFASELKAAAGALDQEYRSNLLTLKQTGAPPKGGVIRRLGQLHDDGYYPASIEDSFGIEWSFPSLKPDDRLRHLNPALYEAECEKMKARFGEAVKMAEAVFVEQFEQLVEKMAGLLAPAPDGSKKVFRGCHAENLKSFFKQFEELNIGSNPQLEQLVAKAKAAVDGVGVDQLKKDAVLRKDKLAVFQEIGAQLETLVVDAPSRMIRRRKKAQAEAGAAEQAASQEGGSDGE